MTSQRLSSTATKIALDLWIVMSLFHSHFLHANQANGNAVCSVATSFAMRFVRSRDDVAKGLILRASLRYVYGTMSLPAGNLRFSKLLLLISLVLTVISMKARGGYLKVAHGFDILLLYSKTRQMLR